MDHQTQVSTAEPRRAPAFFALIGRLRNVQLLGLLLAWGILILVISRLAPYFLTLNNVLTITKYSVTSFVAAAGMTIALISGGLDLSLEELNEAVQGWLKEIDSKELRELGESRAKRFDHEKQYLIPLPPQPYDWREVHELMVSRESCISFETNRYSVPPRHIGQVLTFKVDRLSG